MRLRKIKTFAGTCPMLHWDWPACVYRAGHNKGLAGAVTSLNPVLDSFIISVTNPVLKIPQVDTDIFSRHKADFNVHEIRCSCWRVSMQLTTNADTYCPGFTQAHRHTDTNTYTGARGHVFRSSGGCLTQLCLHQAMASNDSQWLQHQHMLHPNEHLSHYVSYPSLSFSLCQSVCLFMLSACHLSIYVFITLSVCLLISLSPFPYLPLTQLTLLLFFLSLLISLPNFLSKSRFFTPTQF